MSAGPGAVQRIRGLSVTVWIIIACVLVYAIDGLTVPIDGALAKPSSWTTISISTAESMPAGPYAFVPPLNEAPQLLANPQTARGRSVLAQRNVYSGEKQVGTIIYQNMPLLKRWGFFSTATALVGFDAQGNMQGAQFWRFLSFQFLHADFFHIFVNMFGLWIFGPLVERHLGGKRFLAFYLLCGIFGAFMYLLLNAAGAAISAAGLGSVPFLLFNDTHLPLIGASAGMFGVLLAGAYLSPNSMVLLFFVIPMRLVTLAYGLVAVALFTLLFQNESPGSNAGGEAAHLGGAIAGFYFIRRQHHLHGFFDFLGRVDPTSRSSKARRLDRDEAPPKRAVDDAEIDRILAKIHEKGLQSLSAKEKRTLRASSKR